MKEYEVIREIPNSCSNNQMRDISFYEVECESPVAYVRSQFPDKGIELRTDRKPDGTTVIYAEADSLIHKFIFSEI